jgi:NAD(P)H-hydrate epimerase
VLAGSKGKTGAATLLCNGASRAGAGLVTLFIPSSLNAIMEAKLTEPMTFPIPETEDQTPASAAAEDILTFLDGKQAFAAGPGISTHPDTEKLIKALIPRLPCPAVLDADAITVLAGQPKLFQKAIAPLILTPHPGEMARLIRGSNKTVQENRMEIAAEFSKKYGVTLVLKGFRTVVAAPDGRLAVNSSGNPAMASGGMGDILTGLIAGFLAQGFEPFIASCLGVYVHGAAADLRFGKVASRGLLASEVLDAVPRVIGEIEGVYQEC